MSYLKKILNNKKNAIEKIIIVLVIGIVFMVLGDFGNSEKKEECSNVTKIIQPELKSVEKEMEEILEKIDGAGEVKVMITYKTSKEVIHQMEKKETINDAKEDDKGNTTRTTKQREFTNSIAFEENNGFKKAVIKKEIEPLIKGVVVVAGGAYDDNVKRNLQMAAQILTDIPIHKISVFAMKK